MLLPMQSSFNAFHLELERHLWFFVEEYWGGLPTKVAPIGTQR
jgi:hypothetical protein